jgi:hypothetical protein
MAVGTVGAGGVLVWAMVLAEVVKGARNCFNRNMYSLEAGVKKKKLVARKNTVR